MFALLYVIVPGAASRSDGDSRVAAMPSQLCCLALYLCVGQPLGLLHGEFDISRLQAEDVSGSTRRRGGTSITPVRVEQAKQLTLCVLVGISHHLGCCVSRVLEKLLRTAQVLTNLPLAHEWWQLHGTPSLVMEAGSNLLLSQKACWYVTLA